MPEHLHSAAHQPIALPKFHLTVYADDHQPRRASVPPAEPTDPDTERELENLPELVASYDLEISDSGVANT